MYRSLIFSAYCLLAAAQVQAQQRQKVTVQHVTVFLGGAEVENTASVNLPAGGGEVIFTNIAGNVNEESINVGTDNDKVLIQSVTFQANHLEDGVLSPLAQSYKDSIATLSTQKEQTSNRLGVVNEQLAVLKANEKVGGNNSGLNTAELQKMLDLVDKRMGTFLEEKTTLENKIKRQDSIITRLNQQMADENNRPVGQIVVKFYNKAAAETRVGISYVTSQANWHPSYDVRTAKLGDPLDILYKADIRQTTGVKWDNARLSLSTGNPSESASAPVFSPSYLSFYQPQPISNKSMTANTRIAIGEAKSESAMYIVDGAQVIGTYGLALSSTSAVATTYDIELPYIVPADGQEHQVVINSTQIPAQYRYYAYPKADHDAFLQAQVTNWEALNLLPGNVNVFYNGTYVGQSYLDVRNVKDTLTFSLGRDKKIVLKRTQDTKMRSTKTIGTNTREQYGYTIAIRNTHVQPIDIVVTDQVPVSNDKDISLEDIETNGGAYNETTGEVDWHLTLNANETKELKLGYTIKYPKSKTLNSH